MPMPWKYLTIYSQHKETRPLHCQHHRNSHLLLFPADHRSFVLTPWKSFFVWRNHLWINSPLTQIPCKFLFYVDPLEINLSWPPLKTSTLYSSPWNPFSLFPTKSSQFHRNSFYSSPQKHSSTHMPEDSLFVQSYLRHSFFSNHSKEQYVAHLINPTSKSLCISNPILCRFFS